MIESILLKDNLGELFIEKKNEKYFSIIRKNHRNKIINLIDHVQYFDSNNDCKLLPSMNQFY